MRILHTSDKRCIIIYPATCSYNPTNRAEHRVRPIGFYCARCALDLFARIKLLALMLRRRRTLSFNCRSAQSLASSKRFKKLIYSLLRTFRLSILNLAIQRIRVTCDERHASTIVSQANVRFSERGVPLDSRSELHLLHIEWQR